MSAAVHVTNPGFTEALTSLAHLGRRIDAAVRGASLGVPLVPAVLGSGGGEPKSGSGHGDQGSQALYSVPPPPALVPAFPGLDSLQALSRSIAEAISATLLPKLDEIAKSISACCAKIAETIATACKCAGVPAEVSQSLQRIERSLVELADFSFLEALGEAVSFGASLAALVALVAGLPIALMAAVASITGILGYWALKEYGSNKRLPESVDRSTDQALEDARSFAKRPLTAIPEHAQGLVKEQRIEILRRHIQDFESMLKGLQEIIEDPEAETDSRKHELRERAKQVLPSLRTKLEELLRLYKEATEEEPAFDSDLQEWLYGTDKPDENSPSFSPTQQPKQPEMTPPPQRNPEMPVPEPWLDLAAFPNGNRSDGMEPLIEVMKAMIARLREPVRLELRILDDRVMARRLDGNRSVHVDWSRGPRLVGYLSV